MEVGPTLSSTPLATLIRIPPLFVESGSLSQRLPPGARSNFHSPGLVLPPQTELLDQGAVALEVRALEVVEQPATAPDELEQAAARVVVLRVRAQVLGELVDPGGEKGDLNFRRTGVALVPAVLADDLQLGFLGQSHATPG